MIIYADTTLGLGITYNIEIINALNLDKIEKRENYNDVIKDMLYQSKKQSNMIKNSYKNVESPDTTEEHKFLWWQQNILKHFTYNEQDNVTFFKNPINHDVMYDMLMNIKKTVTTNSLIEKVTNIVQDNTFIAEQDKRKKSVMYCGRINEGQDSNNLIKLHGDKIYTSGQDTPISGLHPYGYFANLSETSTGLTKLAKYNISSQSFSNVNNYIKVITKDNNKLYSIVKDNDVLSNNFKQTKQNQYVQIHKGDWENYWRIIDLIHLSPECMVSFTKNIINIDNFYEKTDDEKKRAICSQLIDMLMGCKNIDMTEQNYNTKYVHDYNDLYDMLKNNSNMSESDKFFLQQHLYFYGFSPSSSKKHFYPTEYSGIVPLSIPQTINSITLSLLAEINTKGVTKRINNFLVPVSFVSLFIICDVYLFNSESISAFRSHSHYKNPVIINIGFKGRSIGMIITLDIQHMINRIMVSMNYSTLRDKILYSVLYMLSIMTSLGVVFTIKNNIMLIISLIWYPNPGISISIKTFMTKHVRIENQSIHNPIYITQPDTIKQTQPNFN